MKIIGMWLISDHDLEYSDDTFRMDSTLYVQYHYLLTIVVTCSRYTLFMDVSSFVITVKTMR